MEKVNKIIEAILDFKNKVESIDKKIPNKLLGTLGEYYVVDKLQKHEWNPELKGGQGGYDILLDGGEKIEVKTSLLKDEGIYGKNEGIHYWGWAVQREQKDIKFDYLICVALDESWSIPKFYIFTKEEAESIEDVEIGRFKGVKKGICLFRDNKTYERASNLKPKYITKFARNLNEKPRLFLDKWEKLR